MNRKNKFLLCVIAGFSFLSAGEFEFDFYESRVWEECDIEIFNLLQENILNLRYIDVSNDSAQELLNLIEEGYKIDSVNMALLIDTLPLYDASNNATKVILQAIVYDSVINAEHLAMLIRTVTKIDASNNATKVLLKAIEHGIKFGPKERLLLAEASKMASTKSNVEKIRKALHERQRG